MGNFNRDRDNRSGGGRSFGRRDFNRNDRGGSGGDRQMFKTVCSNCGKECEVPFRPNGSKPVYCSECFEKQGGGNDRGDSRPRFENRSFESRGGSQPQNSAQLDAISAKLDQIIKLLTPEVKVEIQEAPAVVEEIAVEKPAKKLKKVPDRKDE